MALKTSCPCCGKPFSAPEEYQGRKVDCPKCGHRFVLRSREELLAEKAEQEARQRKEEEDRRRLDLIERQEKKQLGRQGGVPYYERYQTGVHPVRHYDPKAPSRFLRLRALSDLLLVGAYAVLMLSLAGAGMTVYLAVEGTVASLVLLAIFLVGWMLLGTVLFLVLKFLGELAFLVAAAGDHQHDIVQLLLDLRENTDRVPHGEP